MASKLWNGGDQGTVIPKREPLRATPTRLRDNTWGAWVEGSPGLGEEVLLVRRDGTATSQHVSEVISPAGSAGPRSLVRLISARVYLPHSRQTKKTTACPKRRFT
jgi:hypothetical protein